VVVVHAAGVAVPVAVAMPEEEELYKKEISSE
jgi:hypothetical protein